MTTASASLMTLIEALRAQQSKDYWMSLQTKRLLKDAADALEEAQAMCQNLSKTIGELRANQRLEEPK